MDITRELLMPDPKTKYAGNIEHTGHISEVDLGSRKSLNELDFELMTGDGALFDAISKLKSLGRSIEIITTIALSTDHNCVVQKMPQLLTQYLLSSTRK